MSGVSNNNMPVQSAQNNGEAGFPKKSGSETAVNQATLRAALDILGLKNPTKAVASLTLRGVNMIKKLQDRDEKKISAVKYEIEKIVHDLQELHKGKNTKVEGNTSEKVTLEKIQKILGTKNEQLKPMLENAKSELEKNHKLLFNKIIEMSDSKLLSNNEKIVTIVKQIALVLAYCLLFGYVADLINYLVQIDGSTIKEKALNDATDKGGFEKLVKDVNKYSQMKKTKEKEIKSLTRELATIAKRITTEEARLQRRVNKLETLQGAIYEKASAAQAPAVQPQAPAVQPQAPAAPAAPVVSRQLDNNDSTQRTHRGYSDDETVAASSDSDGYDSDTDWSFPSSSSSDDETSVASRSRSRVPRSNIQSMKARGASTVRVTRPLPSTQYPTRKTQEAANNGTRANSTIDLKSLLADMQEAVDKVGARTTKIEGLEFLNNLDLPEIK